MRGLQLDGNGENVSFARAVEGAFEIPTAVILIRDD